MYRIYKSKFALRADWNCISVNSGNPVEVRNEKVENRVCSGAGQPGTLGEPTRDLACVLLRPGLYLRGSMCLLSHSDSSASGAIR